MLNPFFQQGSKTEQGLIQDLINEQLRMYGVEVYYLPRKYITEKTILREVIESKFDDAYPIEAYVQNFDGYNDNTTILSKFGIQSTQEISLIISKERFEFLINRLISNLRINRVWAARRFMRDFISSQEDHAGQKYWVETTPLNIAQARRILKLFPDALFINMVRDPRDVIASLLTKNWGPTTPLEGLEWIEKRLRDAHKALAHIPANQKITIALEDLAINNRLQSYQSLLKFLNLGDDAGMKEFFETHLSAEAAMSGRWKQEIATPEFLAGYAELEKRLALLR